MSIDENAVARNAAAKWKVEQTAKHGSHLTPAFERQAAEAIAAHSTGAEISAGATSALLFVVAAVSAARKAHGDPLEQAARDIAAIKVAEAKAVADKAAAIEAARPKTPLLDALRADGMLPY